MKPKRIYQVYNQKFTGWHGPTDDGGHRWSTRPFKGASKMPTWRFRVIASRNKQIVGGSQESFDSKGNALRAARRDVSLYPEGVAVVEEAPK